MLTRTYEQIRQRLQVFVGVPFDELSEQLGVPGIDLPAVSRKSFGADMTEAMLDVAKNSLPAPDIAAIGAEEKSIPLFPDGRPRENTKITSLTLRTVEADSEFFESHLYEKMRVILFMPIQKNLNERPHQWYLRPPFLWLPSTDDLAVIRRDYARYVHAIREERWDALSLTNGEHLGVNTSGALSANMERRDKPYAWWLKKSLTTRILRENLSAAPWIAAARPRTT